MTVENLEGRRLMLRPLAGEDADALFEAVDASRQALKRRLRWVPDVRGAEDEKKFIDGAAASEDSQVWGVFESRMRRLVGVASLERMEGPERSQARFGIWIRADRQDRGYGAEAGRLVLDSAFRRAGLHRVFSRIDPTNRSFRKVLKKLGFRYEGCLRGDKRLNGRWVDQECWGMLKAEWKK